MEQIPEFDMQAFLALFDDDSVASDLMEPYYILGFITATASAPEVILPSEWQPELWRDEGGSAASTFKSPQQAENFVANIMGWWNLCCVCFSEKRPLPWPEDISFNKEQGASSALVEFASGYLNAYDWLEEVWDSIFAFLDESEGEELVESDDPEQDLEQDPELSIEMTISRELSMMLGVASLTLLQCIIYPKSVTQNDVEGGGSEDLETEAMLKDVFDHADIEDMLAHLLSDIGHIGLILGQELNDDLEPLPQAPISAKDFQQVGRNEPCPCGSGKKFKKCCLH